MPKKNTIAALRIRKEMKEKSLSGADLAALANLSYYAVENVLSGKSSKLDKLEAIAKALGKPLLYFVDPHYDSESAHEDKPYDGELHYKVIKIISDFCKRKKIFITKKMMNNLVENIYPRLKREDPEELIVAQTEAVASYILREKKNKS